MGKISNGSFFLGGMIGVVLSVDEDVGHWPGLLLAGLGGGHSGGHRRYGHAWLGPAVRLKSKHSVG